MFLWRSQSALHWGVWEVTWGVILTFAGIASSGEDEGEGWSGEGSWELLVNLVGDERQWIEVVRSERVEELRKNNPPRSTTLKGSVYVWELYWSLKESGRVLRRSESEEKVKERRPRVMKRISLLLMSLLQAALASFSNPGPGITLKLPQKLP